MRIGKHEIPPIALWVAGVVAFVLIVPMITFYFRERPWSFGALSGKSETPQAQAVRSAGMSYSVSRTFSLRSARPDSELPRNDDPSRGLSPYLEVVQPGANGDVWVVHHPPASGVRPYVRRYSADGSVRAGFTAAAGSTLFTPGRDGDLWVDVAAGSGNNERVVHYSATGKILGEYPLAQGLFARAISIDPAGGVWALSEEWGLDPETKAVSLQAALVPVAMGKPLATPKDPASLVLDGAFFGADGLLYRIRSEGQVAEGTNAPPYTVTSWTEDGRNIGSYSLPAGVRPYAADSEGRLYAEATASEVSVADGLSTLGDAAGETATVWIVDRQGRTTKLGVWRQSYFSNWAPSVWPRPDGTLVTTRISGPRLDVLELRPAEFNSVESSATFLPQLTLIEPTEPPSGDPYGATDDGQRDLMKLVYSGLASLDASLQPVGDLAKRVPTKANGLVSEDGLSIRWEIRSGVSWHDGLPVGPADVVATWRYLKRGHFLPSRRPFVGFDAIEDVRVDGDDVVVRLSRPIGVAPVAFFPYVLPAHLIPTQPTANPRFLAAPVGTGPYRLVRWEDGNGWYLLSHASSPRGNAGVSSLRVVFAVGEAARRAFVEARTPVLWDWVDEVQSAELHKDGIAVAEQPSGRWWGMLFDAAEGPTADKRVREALVADYPARKLREEVYAPSETDKPVDSFPTASAAHDGARTPRVGNEPARALTILRRAGWRLSAAPRLERKVLTRNKRQLTIQGRLTHRAWNDSEIAPDAADAIQMGWRALGIRDSFDYTSKRHYESWWRFGALSFDDFDVALGVFPSAPDPGWGGVFDPHDTPSVANPYGIAVTGTQDSELARLYARAEAEYDPVQRAAIGRKISKRAFDELRLAVGERYEMRRFTVRGPMTGLIVGPLPSGAFFDVTRWKVGESEQ